MKTEEKGNRSSDSYAELKIRHLSRSFPCKIDGGLYSESDIEMVAYEVKNATSQYYVWWGGDGSYGNSSFRNSLGLSPTVDIEKALAMRITRLYNDTMKNLMDVNLNRIKFAEMLKDLSEQATKNITQGELF